MENFDFSAPADVFSVARRGCMSHMSYRRFANGAEAIRHAVEVLGSELLVGTAVENDQARLNGAEIKAMYECSAYPLQRQAKVQGK